MPDVLHGLMQHLGDDVMEVAVTPRAGEDDDTEFHRAILPDSPSGSKVGSLDRLDGVVLQHGIGEELLAHLVDARLCGGWRRRVDDDHEYPSRPALAAIAETRNRERPLHQRGPH